MDYSNLIVCNYTDKNSIKEYRKNFLELTKGEKLYFKLLAGEFKEIFGEYINTTLDLKVLLYMSNELDWGSYDKDDLSKLLSKIDLKGERLNYLLCLAGLEVPGYNEEDFNKIENIIMQMLYSNDYIYCTNKFINCKNRLMELLVHYETNSKDIPEFDLDSINVDVNCFNSSSKSIQNLRNKMNNNLRDIGTSVANESSSVLVSVNNLVNRIKSTKCYGLDYIIDEIENKPSILDDIKEKFNLTECVMNVSSNIDSDIDSESDLEQCLTESDDSETVVDNFNDNTYRVENINGDIVLVSRDGVTVKEITEFPMLIKVGDIIELDPRDRIKYNYGFAASHIFKTSRFGKGIKGELVYIVNGVNYPLTKTPPVLDKYVTEAEYFGIQYFYIKSRINDDIDLIVNIVTGEQEISDKYKEYPDKRIVAVVNDRPFADMHKRFYTNSSYYHDATLVEVFQGDDGKFYGKDINSPRTALILNLPVTVKEGELVKIDEDDEFISRVQSKVCPEVVKPKFKKIKATRKPNVSVFSTVSALVLVRSDLVNTIGDKLSQKGISAKVIDGHCKKKALTTELVKLKPDVIILCPNSTSHENMWYCKSSIYNVVYPKDSTCTEIFTTLAEYGYIK